ncbi:MAG: exo-alpha-sialidase [Candidatus Latescibacteria bacterium]|nr:exo-alpha-sialidase [Candidatus Latescibacterota bacterium]
MNKGSETPVVKWTAQDAPNFRYPFLDNVRTTQLVYATPETGTFNLHGYLAYFKGVLFACWDSQARDENTSGQHGVFRYSTDDGETWSDLKTLFPSLADNIPASEVEQPNPFQTSQGFVKIDDRLYVVTCVDRSLNEKVYRYNEVSRIRIGFLVREVRTDGTLGDLFWLSDIAPEPEPGYPAYPVGDPALVSKINAYLKEPANLLQLLFRPREHPDSDDDHRMTEPTPPWRLDNGTWVRLYRDSGSIHAENRAEVEASKSRRNYAAFSFDDGQTWTAPTWTSFPDSCARSNAGKLPDGQVYVINNILTMSPSKGGRSMLAISLSRDGLHFDHMAVLRFAPPPQRYQGKAKRSNGFQYPHSVVVGEYLWVIYSVSKEDMEVARIPLSELYKLDQSSHSPREPQRR